MKIIEFYSAVASNCAGIPAINVMKATTSIPFYGHVENIEA
jgi:hypothetical protein